MRLKEDAHDYRYFPDPDLIPLALDEARIARARAALPELPAARRARFQAEHALSAADAGTLTASRAAADFFEAAARAHGDAGKIGRWLLRDVARVLKDHGLELGDPRVKLVPEALARLVRLVDTGRTTASNAQSLVEPLVLSGGDPEALVRERGLEAISDGSALEAAVDAVLAANAAVVERIRAGEDKLVNALMGQVMKGTQGKADPGAVREILARKLRGR
jgi:aspartyl-tRNA(Asn)/glutamyl-tRNA(Gln) amidotransferase subunit B